MTDWDEVENIGHGLVVACSIGALAYVIVAALMGYL